jgi:carboxypeptidase Q
MATSIFHYSISTSSRAITRWAVIGSLFLLMLAPPGISHLMGREGSDEERATLSERFGLTLEQTDTLLRVIDEGKNRSQTMKHLTYLCEEIGPRLTGSSRLERANYWVAEQFKAFGLENVEVRQWGELPVRFDRGPSTGRMVSPVERQFEFTTRSWSAGTEGPLEGKVIAEPATEEGLDAIADQLKGAWILRKPGSQTSPFESRLESAGINGYIQPAQGETVTTGGVRGIMQLEIEKISPIVTTFVRRSDYDAINSRLADGEEVVVEFNLEHKFTSGPIPLYNTIGEIRGTELPDEVVIISAHLDSWDGPGSQGTVDNGTGSSVTIEAARILAAAGVKPKRTIRFILWTGEEQGLLGSRAYVESLSDEERAKISAVFVDDSGTNQQSSLTCAAPMEAMLRQAIAPMNYAFSEVPIQLNVQPRMPTRGGASDHASFNAVGIPGFFWGKSGTASYRYAWHTQNDRLDQAVPEYLVKNATVSAIAAFVLSEAETLLPRPPVAEEAEEADEPRRQRLGRRGGAQRAGGEGGRERAPGRAREGSQPDAPNESGKNSSPQAIGNGGNG